MTEKTEALRLVDVAFAARDARWHTQADDELRRLHVDAIEAAAELRRLHASCEDYAQHKQRQDQRVLELAERVLELKAQRDALLEALKEYGWHHEGCPQYPTYTHPDRWPACTCGFDDAIKAVEGEKE